jgi:hypothetical protein
MYLNPQQKMAPPDKAITRTSGRSINAASNNDLINRAKTAAEKVKIPSFQQGIKGEISAIIEELIEKLQQPTTGNHGEQATQVDVATQTEPTIAANEPDLTEVIDKKVDLIVNILTTYIAARGGPSEGWVGSMAVS